jgi:hypothetical protein
MHELVNSLRANYPDLHFSEGAAFYWSPKDKTVYFTAVSTLELIAEWSLLHELAHAVLGHKSYADDYELVQLEVAAWQKAQKLAKKYGYEIDQNHIQDCLDTYRDWQHRRSTCPTCQTISAQADPRTYECFNCRTRWTVGPSRFCRPYRRLAASKQKPLPAVSESDFI